jgi:desampylase
MVLPLILDDRLRAQLTAEARAAFPKECCGLLEGESAGQSVRVVALHATANVSADPTTGFEVDPAAHLRLRRTLRTTGGKIVGCYHSHPNGRAKPSERDRANGTEEGFIWLIAALSDAQGAVALAAFEGPAFEAVTLAGPSTCT